MTGGKFHIQENGVGDIRVLYGEHPNPDPIPCSRPFCHEEFDSMQELLEHERVAHPEIWEEEDDGRHE